MPELTPRQRSDLLTALYNAGILDEADGRFRSGLLRRYWRRYHVG